MSSLWARVYRAGSMGRQLGEYVPYRSMSQWVYHNRTEAVMWGLGMIAFGKRTARVTTRAVPKIALESVKHTARTGKILGSALIRSGQPLKIPKPIAIGGRILPWLAVGITLYDYAAWASDPQTHRTWRSGMSLMSNR